MRVVAIPGTLCAPAVFDRLAQRVPLEAVSWMTEPGPWDLGTVADRIADRLTEPAVVVGHSTGGAIALRLAVRHATLVAGLLLVNTGAHMRGHGDVDRILGLIETAWGPELHAAVLARSFATPPDPDMLAVLVDYAARVPAAAALQALRSQRDLDLTPRLGELVCPVTVVHGTLDPTRTPTQAQELAHAIPGARLRFVHSGHTPVHEVPDTVAAELTALLSREH
jgi:pimeloyl-ACP methyl ester carboxylesterase